MRDLLYQLVDRRRTKRFVARVPVDLLLVVGATVIAITTLNALAVTSSVVWTLIGLPLLFFAPGYVVVATLFPRARPATPEERGVIRQTRSVSALERGALAFGLSVAVVPLIGLAIAATSWGFTRTVVVRAVVGFVVVGALLAAIRRFRVPLADRYRFSPRRLLGSVRTTLVADSRAHTAVNVVLIATVLLALSSVGYALAAPGSDESYSDLYVLTESDDGDLVASGYPEEVTAGEPQELVVGVDNHEGERTQYELVVVVDRVDTAGDVVEREELERVGATVADGERFTHDHEIAPTMTGDDLRVSYLLFDGEAPADPTVADATEHVYFWTDVEAA